MKRPADWSELQGLDPSLVSAIRDIYTSPAHFDGAFDDEEGASLTTAELLGDKKPAGEIEQAAAALWKWKQRRLSRGQSSTRQLAQQLAALPVTVPRRQRSIGEVFEEVVLTTPAVALSQLQRAVRASKASGSREDVELRMRERWALQLVCYIKESKLPCAERLAALGDSQATWLRIFGNRRGKTLRNRARSWKPVRDWLQITYGIPWASDAGQILKYLEERHAVAPLAKTVPRASGDIGEHLLAGGRGNGACRTETVRGSTAARKYSFVERGVGNWKGACEAGTDAPCRSVAGL